MYLLPSFHCLTFSSWLKCADVLHSANAMAHLMRALQGAGSAGILAHAKLQPGMVSHAVSTANVKVALDHLSAAGLDLTVRACARYRRSFAPRAS